MIQQSRVEEGVETVGKRFARQESIGLAACQLARDLVNIQQSRVPEDGVEKVGKRTPSDPMETSCRCASLSDWPSVSSHES